MTDRSRISKSLAAIALAAGLFAGGMPAGADDLRMYILNDSPHTLYFETQVGVENWPATIAPGQTSDEIRATEKGGGGDGQITYMNASNPVTATCTATLGYGFAYHSDTSQCADKKFSPQTSSDACSLVHTDCYGSDSCKCNFTFKSE